jgi:hypothetical protein
MKNYALFLSIFISLNAFSQIQKPILKGNFIIDGDASFLYTKSTSQNGNSYSKNSIYDITLYPTCAYFIANNLAIGLSVPLDYGVSNDSKSYFYGVGPIIKYYFNKGPFLKMNLSYTYSKSTGTYITDTKYFELEPGIGFAFFINPKVSIEPSLNYTLMHNTSDTFPGGYSYKANTIKLHLGITVFI